MLLGLANNSYLYELLDFFPGQATGENTPSTDNCMNADQVFYQCSGPIHVDIYPETIGAVEKDMGCILLGKTFHYKWAN